MDIEPPRFNQNTPYITLRELKFKEKDKMPAS